MVLQEAIEKDGAVLSDSALGDQIRQAVGIMDGPITEALQSGAAPEALELWRVNTEHISKVYKNGGKSTAYILFADETWFCIKSLLLGHVTIIQLYCVMKGESISPRTMNTDTVE